MFSPGASPSFHKEFPVKSSISIRRFLLSALVAAAAAFGALKAAEACSHAPPTPPVLCIERIDATHFCILFKNYTTAGGALPGQFCTCALRRLGPIISIDSFQMRFCGTSEAVPGWNFIPNPNSSTAWSQALEGPATGFFSNVGIPIPPQRCIDLKFIITVAPTTTANQLAMAFAAGGLVVGNGEAGPNGFPLAGAVEIRPSGPIMIITPACPGDINGDGNLSVQDIFDFLAFYFTNDPRSDVNSSGTITVQDIFDFLALYFVGCP
jgi:hypothetical protein